MATKKPAKAGAGKATAKKAAVKKPAAAKKAPAKKAPAKKVVAKKAPAKKVPAKKVPAKKVPAKKVPAKKVPAKKVAAKKVAARTYWETYPGPANTPVTLPQVRDSQETLRVSLDISGLSDAALTDVQALFNAHGIPILVKIGGP